MSTVAFDPKISELWEFEPKKEGRYTENQIIDAYLNGKKTGLESYQKALIKTLTDNVDKCGEYTEEIIGNLKNRGIKTSSAFLKIRKFDCFRVILCVEEEDFLKEDFLSVYDYVADLEETKNTESETFSVEFSFLDYIDSFCEDTLTSDGYILKLKK